MKIANWNIEWMNDWFLPGSDPNAPGWRQSNPDRGITDVGALATRVAAVIRTMDPDVLAVQEGPSAAAEMQLFVRDFLGDAYDVLGPAGRGAQKLYVLVKKAGPVTATLHRPQPGQIDFVQAWEVDYTGDLVLDSYEFTRAPLAVTLTAGGSSMLLVNIHSKSKYVHNGEALWRNLATRQEFVVKAVRNRRRIAAELMRVRAWLDELLHADPEARIVVCGDLNDGPGADYFEKNFLVNNVVSIVSGNPFHPRRMLRHAFIDRELKERNWTARFDDYIENALDRPLLLDHILLSPSLYWGPFRNARIEHDAFDAQIDTAVQGRMSAPSDHRPQSADFEV